MKAWEDVCSGAGDGQLIIPAGMAFMLQPLKFEGSCKSTPIVVQVLCFFHAFLNNTLFSFHISNESTDLIEDFGQSCCIK